MSRSFLTSLFCPPFVSITIFDKYIDINICVYVSYDFVEKCWRRRRVLLQGAYHQVAKDLLALLFNLKLKKVLFFLFYELIFVNLYVGVCALGLLFDNVCFAELGDVKD